MKLSLAPVPYFWPRDQLVAFYREVATWPLDIVYLGETVCSKRRSFTLEDWLEIGAQLAATGKEVILSTLALLEAESELLVLRHQCSNGRFGVEANDLGAIQLLSAHGVPFITGPSVNVYNPATLAVLARQGLRRWVLPVELSRDALIGMQAQRPAGVETEVLAFGRLPLAFSARCFTARSRNLPKDDCQYCCLDYPDGRVLHTRENTPFLVLNGIQTLSARHCNLLSELPELQRLGVEVMRVTPQPLQTQHIVETFAAALRNELDPTKNELDHLATLGVCNGYWQGKPGMLQEPGSNS